MRRRAGNARRREGSGRRWTVVAEADAPALVVPIAAEAAPIGNEKVSRQPNLAAGLDP
jgi:hypothetical protein